MLRAPTGVACCRGAARGAPAAAGQLRRRQRALERRDLILPPPFQPLWIETYIVGLPTPDSPPTKAMLHARWFRTTKPGCNVHQAVHQAYTKKSAPGRGLVDREVDQVDWRPPEHEHERAKNGEQARAHNERDLRASKRRAWSARSCACDDRVLLVHATAPLPRQLATSPNRQARTAGCSEQRFATFKRRERKAEGRRTSRTCSSRCDASRYSSCSAPVCRAFHIWTCKPLVRVVASLVVHALSGLGRVTHVCAHPTAPTGTKGTNQPQGWATRSAGKNRQQIFRGM